MATEKQELGTLGETLVVKKCSCPSCKRVKTLKRLPTNYKCADVICDFCGFVAQVKTRSTNEVTKLPRQVLGAAWGPQAERMSAGRYFPLYLVQVSKSEHAIFYLSADLQSPDLFVPRNPLSNDAKRAGWQGFNYNLESYRDRIIRLQ